MRDGKDRDNRKERANARSLEILRLKQAYSARVTLPHSLGVLLIF